MGDIKPYSTRSLLILAYECHPFNKPGSTIGAQRPYQFGKNLSLLGWNVIILTADFAQRETISKNNIGKLQTLVASYLSSEGLSIIPLPSLRSKGLWDKLWKFTVINNNGVFEPKKGFILFLIRKIASFLKLFTGDYSKSWQPVAYNAGQYVIESRKVDFILAEHGPDASLFVARSLSKKYDIPFLVDFRDPVLQPIPKLVRPIYKIFLKKFLLKEATAIINVNPAWVKMDEVDFGHSSFMVTNGFDPSEFDHLQPVRSTQFLISYIGNVSFPSKVDLLFESLSLLKKRDVGDFKFIYRGSAYKKFQKLAEQHDVVKNCDIAEWIERKSALEIMMSSDLLILFSIDQKKNRDPYLNQGYYPGKVFEYMATGNPVLCIPGDNGVLDELLHETSLGVSVSNPEDAVIEIERLMKNKGSYKVDWTRIRFYSRIEQAKRLDKILKDII